MRASGWFILDVMRKGGDYPRNEWTALMIDVDPEIYRAGHCCPTVRSSWVDLGKHKSRDAAWYFAEQLTAARH